MRIKKRDVEEERMLGIPLVVQEFDRLTDAPVGVRLLLGQVAKGALPSR